MNTLPEQQANPSHQEAVALAAKNPPDRMLTFLVDAWPVSFARQAYCPASRVATLAIVDGCTHLGVFLTLGVRSYVPMSHFSDPVQLACNQGAAELEQKHRANWQGSWSPPVKYDPSEAGIPWDADVQWARHSVECAR